MRDFIGFLCVTAVVLGLGQLAYISPLAGGLATLAIVAALAIVGLFDVFDPRA